MHIITHHASRLFIIESETSDPQKSKMAVNLLSLEVIALAELVMYIEEASRQWFSSCLIWQKCFRVYLSSSGHASCQSECACQERTTVLYRKQMVHLIPTVSGLQYLTYSLCWSN